MTHAVYPVVREVEAVPLVNHSLHPRDPGEFRVHRHIHPERHIETLNTESNINIATLTEH